MNILEFRSLIFNNCAKGSADIDFYKIYLRLIFHLYTHHILNKFSHAAFTTF